MTHCLTHTLLLSVAVGACAQMNLDQLREQRQAAAHRKRRIIMNNDGNEPVYYCTKVDRDEFLSKRTAPLASSQVDAIFYCTWSSGFGFFTHDTKVGEVFTTTEEPFQRNLTADFLAAGLDPLRMIVEWCHQQGIEAFWSMRMNDVHDGGYPPMVPQWKHDHPELLFGSLDNKPKGVGDSREWSGVDYARPEVRDRALAFIREVCEKYEVDGIEMDFLRHAVFFKSRAWGEELTQPELDAMTDFVQRVRQMTEKVGLKRGRPILVAVRVPDSVGYCRSIGLDLERWLQEGLVDLMAVSDYVRFQPWEPTIELGHKYGVPVYPCLSESRMKDAAGKIRMTSEAYRARAANAWHAGADGIYTFNYFNPKARLFWEIGDPETLKGLDKTYFVNVRGLWAANAYSKGGEQFVTLPKFSPERPIKLVPNEAATVPITIGESPLAAPNPSVTVNLQVADLADPGTLAVTFNGEALTGDALADAWVSFSVSPESVKVGTNEVSVTLTGDAGPIWTDLTVKVTYPKG
jgi:hypothetical protein